MSSHSLQHMLNESHVSKNCQAYCTCTEEMVSGKRGRTVPVGHVGISARE